MKSGRGVSLRSAWEDEEEKGNERRGNVMGRCWVEMRWKRRKEERRRKSVKLIIIHYLYLKSFSKCD
jgi:hypothetical protein